MIMPKRTITNEEPLTRKEVEAFADSVKIGETVATIITLRKWTSTTTFKEYYRPARVTILNKFPYLVQTDKGIMTWKDMIIGYYQATDGFTGSEIINNEKAKRAA